MTNNNQASNADNAFYVPKVELVRNFDFRSSRPVVLVDQDGVLARWQDMFDHLLRTTLPHIEPIPFEKITSFKTQKFYDEKYKAEIQDMMNTPNYYRNLDPMEGAKDAMNELAEKYDVMICTAPYISNSTCASEKMGWIEEHLGAEWLDRVIITSDKTLVNGDVLIDDKPNITGRSLTPSWKHIVFDAPYNRDHKLRINHWSEGLKVVDEVLAGL